MIGMGRLLRAAGLSVALGSMIGGCAVPTWVPLIGSKKPPAAPAAPAPDTAEKKPPPAPARKHAEDALPTAKAAPLPDASDVMDRVVCVVDNDAITLYELEEVEAQYLYENKEKEPPAAEARKALRRRLLDRLIDSRIQLQLAEREKIVVDDAEISEQIEEIKKKLGASSQAEFDGMLKSQGLTMEGVRKRIKDQIMVQRLMRRKVGMRVSVTEQEIDRYLADNRQKLEVGLSFEARHILFLPKPPNSEAGWEAARQKAQEVYNLLLGGQDFAEAAKKYSEDPSAKDGGSLGKLKRGELAPDIEEAILKLQPGEFTPPFRSKVGYHLFRLDSKETLSGEALTQARNQIRDILYRQKYEARMQEWIGEIRQRAVIDIRM